MTRPICPECKGMLDAQTGVCRSCGWKLEDHPDLLTCRCGERMGSVPYDYNAMQWRCGACGSWENWPITFSYCIDVLDGPIEEEHDE